MRVAPLDGLVELYRVVFLLGPRTRQPACPSAQVGTAEGKLVVAGNSATVSARTVDKDGRGHVRRQAGRRP